MIDGTKGGHTCQSELERSHCGLLVNNLRTKKRVDAVLNWYRFSQIDRDGLNFMA